MQKYLPFLFGFYFLFNGSAGAMEIDLNNIPDWCRSNELVSYPGYNAFSCHKSPNYYLTVDGKLVAIHFHFNLKGKDKVLNALNTNDNSGTDKGWFKVVSDGIYLWWLETLVEWDEKGLLYIKINGSIVAKRHVFKKNKR